MDERTHTEGMSPGGEELTLEKMVAVMRAIGPPPKMPRWKDLTWAQRNMVEREIEATENAFIRRSMWEAYYCHDDNCPWHRSDPSDRQPAPAREGE